MANAKLGQALSSGGLSELKNRILFLIFGLVVFRLGSYIPVPGLDPHRLSMLFQQHQSGLLGMFNMFSGGALSRMTVFALSIMPYISSSIIIQMFGSISPKLSQLKKEGEAGRRKINDYTRYGTLLLGFIQALFIARWLAGQGIALQSGFMFYFVAISTLVTGTMFLMWLGEQMTERGVGNGISMIIFAGIVARFPSAIASVMNQVHQGQMRPIFLIFLLLVVILVTMAVVFFERGTRNIKITHAKRQQGMMATNNFLPLKINMANVIPPIFAQSIILFPITILQFISHSTTSSWISKIIVVMQYGQPGYMLMFTFFIVFFSFFYTALVFNPKETADNLKKSGAIISGIRPGEKTAEFIDTVMTRLTLVAAAYLVIVALIPLILITQWNVPFYFGGTSLLIIVGVTMDFISQVQAHLMSHQYQSMMKGMKDQKGGKGIVRGNRRRGLDGTRISPRNKDDKDGKN